MVRRDEPAVEGPVTRGDDQGRAEEGSQRRKGLRAVFLTHVRSGVDDLATLTQPLPEELVRVGRWPRPDLLPPWEFVRGDGRYDLPGREARVCYLAETAVTAFLERSDLRALRPDLELCKRLADLRAGYGVDDPDVTAGILERAGRVEAEWFNNHGLAKVRPKMGLKILDVRNAAVIERLRVLLAPWLLDRGFGDFQFRDLLDDMDDPRAGTAQDVMHVTQHISGLAFAAGFAGIAYLSRPNLTATCMALFEGAALEAQAKIIPISPSDPDLREAFAIYGLHSAPETTVVAVVREPHSVETGGMVRGFETESADIMPSCPDPP